MTKQWTLIDMSRTRRRIVAPCPPGVPPGRVRFEWPDAVRRIWRRPERLSVSEWAERYRVMEPDGPRPGKWSNATARYLSGPMDAFSLPHVREVMVVAPPQTGKTEILLNGMGFAADHYPGPALMVYDQRELAQRMSTGRVRNLFRLSPRLRGMLTGKQDDEANFFLRLRHMRIGFGWATSVSTLSNVSVRNLFLDEVDKYESTNRQEAGPVSLAYKRVRAYRDTSKIMLSSSPTTVEGEIWLAYLRAQVRFEFAVRCPDCGQYHVMRFSHASGKGCVVWPEGMAAQAVFSGKAARYVCPCGSVWDDFKRDRAVLGGRWQEAESGLDMATWFARHRSRSVAFRFSALVSPFVGLSETASRFITAAEDLKVGKLDAYKDFMNGYLGEPWQEDYSPRKEEAVLALRDERPSGVLPSTEKVAALLAAVDTQDFGFWYEIRAFGYGQECESWQVRSGFVEDLDALDRVLWLPYYDVNGVEHVVHLAGIDSQGHRTREVYDWCIRNRGRTLPINGERRLKQPYTLANLENYPGTSVKIPGGLRLLHVHTKYYKDALHRKLSIAPADPGAWHMNAECTTEWAKQLCAEYVDDLGNWSCPKGRDNHAWDVSVYGFCLADFLGLRYQQPELYGQGPGEPMQTEPRQERPRRRW